MSTENSPCPCQSTLIALIDCILPLPADRQNQCRQSVIARLESEQAQNALMRHRIQQFLERLSNRFVELSETDRIGHLQAVEAAPETANDFRQITEWITESFYATPAGWEWVGFQRVPPGGAA